MKKFKNKYNGEIISQGFYEYRKHHGMYGYICAMENEVVFIYSNISFEVNCIFLFEFEKQN